MMRMYSCREALEDGIALAQQLSKVWGTSDVQPALEAHDQARRCLPLTIRSRAMGIVLQSALPPAVFLRDLSITIFACREVVWR
jgi:2-polyprenyl-6-methoxyphenol hydroxylase-like FAD-dependent oxidoreductase